MPAEEVLTRRALNRALLQRQQLLERAARTPAEEVRHLVGLQAQAPMPPYHGLWSRLEGFDPHDLGRLLTERAAVRMTLMRGTVHLVTVPDALLLRPVVQAMIERQHAGQFGKRMGGADPDKLATSRCASCSPTSRSAGASSGGGWWPGGSATTRRRSGSPRACTCRWCRSRRGACGAPAAGPGTPRSRPGPVACSRTEPAIDEVVLRYLTAFGPASVMDAQSWSGVTRLKEVFERLRPRLLVFTDEEGTELFDLPDAPRPGADVPAPVRLLGEYDNVLLGHADRRRIIPEDFPWKAMLAPGRFVNNLLVDGELRATWWIEHEGKRRATLGVRPARPLSKRERQAVEAEAQRMVEFAAPEAAAHDVRFEPAVG